MIIQGNPDGRADDEANGGHFRRKNMHYDPATTTCGAESGGVDLNRNFPHPEWQRGGESVRVQPELSEPETQNIVEYIQSVLPPDTNGKDRNGMYASNTTTGVMMDLHSYGQDFFWPWAWQVHRTKKGCVRWDTNT